MIQTLAALAAWAALTMLGISVVAQNTPAPDYGLKQRERQDSPHVSAAGSCQQGDIVPTITPNQEVQHGKGSDSLLQYVWAHRNYGKSGAEGTRSVQAVLAEGTGSNVSKRLDFTTPGGTRARAPAPPRGQLVLTIRRHRIGFANAMPITD